MATYRVVLTVKDSYGNVKEVDGGTINVDLATLTKDEVDQIKDALPLRDYIKQGELEAALDRYATDDELAEAVQNTESIRYNDFELKE